MYQRVLALLLLVCLPITASAEVKPYLLGEIGIADTDYDTDYFFDLGGGVQLGSFVDLEVAYNRFGDVGPFGTGVSSFSYGANIGSRASEDARFFFVVGGEQLKVDGSARVNGFQFKINETSTELYGGIGFSFNYGAGLHFRTRILVHDSADLLTFSAGFIQTF
ncbi:outer membrane beta-barrel protein [Halioxenophilus sp. WMMB6]|uniref:outer membrane beta-barrel protein n=1 Tax=Halioxenophilus sp. WMMB6 TaxID=3073815 RepID=UPI00295EA28B|nr:outer membrane beta-barrel protein [Halioxenophilus sp. WMMB6]